MWMNTVTIIAESDKGIKKEEIKIFNDHPELVQNTNIDTTKDSDGDGIVDYIEEYFGTHSNKTDSDGDGLKNGEEVKVEKMSDSRVAFKMISDPLDINGDLDNYVDKLDLNMGNSLLQYNVFQSDIDLLGQRENMAPLYSQKFVGDAWYRAQLGIGNYIYDGEYDWTYVCEKELLEFVNIYSETMDDSNSKTNQAETFLNNAKETLSSLQSLYDTLKKIGDLGESTILKEVNILIEEYYEYIELVNISITKNSINIDILSAQYYQFTGKC